MMDARVLVVDDDRRLLTAYERILGLAGFAVDTADSAETALACLRSGARHSVVLTDLEMPGMSGIELLRSVRDFDPYVSLVVVTGRPSVESAAATIEHGGARYLTKPVQPDVLTQTVRSAAALFRLAQLKRRALEVCEQAGWHVGDEDEIAARFALALDQLWMAYQPIVDHAARRVVAYEALVRTRASEHFPHPGALFDVAERLGRTQELGRRIRGLIATRVAEAPPEAQLFVNLHPHDLCDEALYDEQAPLSAHARRVVLEITERSSLDQVPDVRARLARLRRMGYELAIDDLGAGYAGLTMFSQLAPDVVKLDMSLVRDIDKSDRRQSIVRSLIRVCSAELATRVICEGVETAAERDTLAALGANLMQGYLFAKPAAAFWQFPAN